MTTNSLNNQCLNDFTVSSSTNGVTRSLTVTNTTNAANSSAKIVAQVAGSTAADAQVTTLINGGQTWSLGLDNSDSDAFVVAGNASLGTTNVSRIDTTGIINYPLQSAFLATATSGTNVTGDGTNYTVVFGTEIFDQNGDFDGTSTFTAPVTGKYFFSTDVFITGLTSSHTVSSINMYTTSQNFSYFQNTATERDNNTNLVLQASGISYMTAGDTATCIIIISNGTKVVDVNPGDASFFSGFLIC